MNRNDAWVKETIAEGRVAAAEQFKEDVRNQYMEDKREIDERVRTFQANQKLPYRDKLSRAANLAWEFYNRMRADGHGCYVAVGGLDSITLLMFLRKQGINVPAVSVSILEDRSIQEVHRRLGVTPLHPKKSKVQVLKEFGWPVLSKETATFSINENEQLSLF